MSFNIILSWFENDLFEISAYLTKFLGWSEDESHWITIIIWISDLGQVQSEDVPWLYFNISLQESTKDGGTLIFSLYHLRSKRSNAEVVVSILSSIWKSKDKVHWSFKLEIVMQNVLVCWWLNQHDERWQKPQTL